MPKLQRIQTQDRVLNMIQDNVSNILDPYSSKDIVQGQILQKIVLQSGTNNVAHKLDRTLIGWFIIRQRSAGTVYDTQDTNPESGLFLRLVASANMTVDIYVF